MRKALCFILLLIFANAKLLAQCSSADAGPDKTICSGVSTTIGSSAVSGYTYSWSPSTGLNNPSIAQPTASPTSATTYTLTITSSNLLSNGDFENGYTEFSTEYDFSNSSNPKTNGEYVISSAYHCTCSTYPQSGSSFYALMSPNTGYPNTRAWYVAQSVPSNTNFKFSGYLTKLCSTNAGIQVSMVGNNTGTTTTNFSTTSSCGTWEYFEVNWNSSTNTQVNIEIRANSGPVVNYALDNLKLQCTSSDQVDVTVISGSAPVVTPGGPITYYNQYETQQGVKLHCSAGASYQWYKNDVAISGADNEDYEVDFQDLGIGLTTQYFKCVTPCGTSNVVTVNYYGCDDAGDYPVTITPQSYCGSAIVPSNYVQLASAPSLGTGTAYSWWLSSNNPYSFSVTGSTGHLTGSGGYGNVGVYAKSSLSGVETYMFWVVSTNGGCRTALDRDTQEDIPRTRTGLYPNPATNQVMISSNNKIKTIEIYGMTGARIRTLPIKDVNFVMLNTSSLPSGIYSVKIITDKGVESTKLIIQK